MSFTLLLVHGKLWVVCSGWDQHFEKLFWLLPGGYAGLGSSDS